MFLRTLPVPAGFPGRGAVFWQAGTACRVKPPRGSQVTESTTSSRDTRISLLTLALAVSLTTDPAAADSPWLVLEACQRTPSTATRPVDPPSKPTASRGDACLQATIDPKRSRAFTAVRNPEAECGAAAPHGLETLAEWAQLVAAEADASEILIANANFFYVDLQHFNPYATRCTSIRGFSCQGGIAINERVEPGHREWLEATESNDTHSLVITPDGQASIRTPAEMDGATCAKLGTVVSGYRLLHDGVQVSLDREPPPKQGLEAKDPRLLWYHLLHPDEGLPRTAVGLKEGRIFLVVANDGSRTGNLSIPELGSYLLEQGVTDALLLDGGGSSQLLFQRSRKTVRSTPGSDDAKWRKRDDPPDPERLQGCKRRMACTLEQVPCISASGCHRPVPAFLAFSPRGGASLSTDQPAFEARGNSPSRCASGAEKIPGRVACRRRAKPE
ncbi:MAG TPA: hypothetical protein EYQ60_17480 [Myxococcales bacterium]|nr:hypothetical protein [Myxococcales bacterium]HIL80766.1 hypothetical protein [Myxococcales bacterium]